MLPALGLLRRPVIKSRRVLQRGFLLLCIRLGLLLNQYEGHLCELGCQPGGLLGERQGLLVQIQLGEHCTELEHEAAVVASEVD